jgi:GTPase SAR1 family protein
LWAITIYEPSSLFATADNRGATRIPFPGNAFPDTPIARRRNFEATFKILIVGNSSVGKTSLLLRFVRDQWKADTQPTLGVDFLTKVVALERRRVQLKLWDTAGDELFRSLTRGYYRGASGALLIFDLTHPDSFAAVAQ